MVGIQGKARVFALALGIAIPVLAALGGSFLLGREIFQAGQAQSRAMRAQEVRAQSRLLLENVWGSLENVKIRASSRIADPALPLDRGIETITAIGSISNQVRGEIRDSGVGVLASGRTLGLVFPIAKANSWVLAQVSPERVFSAFRRWATRREAGDLRGYLIDSRGRVLVHSEPAYAGADFGNTQGFKEALRPLFQGEQTSGMATFMGADLRPVLTSYSRVGNLPLAVVVERVVHPVGAALLRQNLIPAGLLLLSLALLCGISLAAIRSLVSVPQTALTLDLESAIAEIIAAQKHKADEQHASAASARVIATSSEQEQALPAAEPRNGNPEQRI